MGLDQYFKELEIKSEKDLYKQSFRMAIDSREQLREDLKDESKVARKKKWAREALWAIGALFVGALFAWMLEAVMNDTLKNDLATTLVGIVSTAAEKGFEPDLIKESAADLTIGNTDTASTAVIDSLAITNDRTANRPSLRPQKQQEPLTAEDSMQLDQLWSYIPTEDAETLDHNTVEQTAEKAFRKRRYLLYGLAIVCILGVYVARMISWSLKSIAEERK